MSAIECMFGCVNQGRRESVAVVDDLASGMDSSPPSEDFGRQPPQDLAAEQAVHSPLLEDIHLSGARGVLVNITASHSMKLKEVHEVMNTIRSFTAEDTTEIYGSVIDEAIGNGVLHVSVRAATCDDASEHAACHLHQQDWGIPIRVIASGAERLDLMLRGVVE